MTNWVFTTLTRFGLGASYRHPLTVRGRKTGLRVTRPYFDATPASSDSRIEAELARHPGLGLIPKP